MKDDDVNDEELRIGWFAEGIYFDQVILAGFALNKVHVINRCGLISILSDN